MDIKLFSLCKQEMPASETGKKCILNCVSAFFPECEEFTPFTSQKRMLLAISQSLRAADIVVVAVQNNMYNATKRLLCAALGMNLEKSDEIADRLDGKLTAGKINQPTYDANVMFPSGSLIFLTDDGLNSGFAMTSGGQHIIYLPIEAPKCEEAVYGSLYDYLAGIDEAGNIEAAMENRHSEIIERTAEKLNEDSVKVAIHSEVMQKFIVSRADKHKLNAGMIFDDEFPQRDNQQLSDFYNFTARDLRDRHHAQLGVVFSKPYSDEESGETFLIVSIADESGTSIYKYYAEDGEKAEDLFALAVDKTMLMLYDYSGFTDSYVEEPTSDSDKKLRKSIAVLTSVAVGATAIIGLITAFILK